MADSNSQLSKTFQPKGTEPAKGGGTKKPSPPSPDMRPPGTTPAKSGGKK